MVHNTLRFHRRNIPSIEPLTYRDSETLLAMLLKLSDYVENTLHPSLQTIVNRMMDDTEKMLDLTDQRFTHEVERFTEEHEAFMADVHGHLQAMNERVIVDLIEDEFSPLGRALRNIFETRNE